MEDSSGDDSFHIIGHYEARGGDLLSGDIVQIGPGFTCQVICGFELFNDKVGVWACIHWLKANTLDNSKRILNLFII